MTKRPIFITSGDIKNPVIEQNIEFDWVKGLSYTQKCKRREEFHKAISKFFSLDTILEVSTKSNVDIGIKLSALNLKFNYNNIIESVENVYQTSKIILNNIIVGFKYQDIVFENEPMGMFYDWVYINALVQHKEYFNELSKYKIFTDIEFNPKKSYNTQARAVALFLTLYKNDRLDIIHQKEFKEYYIDVFKKTNNNNEQISLF